ncbi:unnamed protein product [Rotaria sp. Silwood2]|nr:unnamed protein product [Rotaria sp. Silwood2]CAF2748141.1 unnamed protein product [Rotaria sp. Silwood2]CAF3060053.1 unnamed protein product [Rotaria sp. Silwood2]CAF3175753.1 unnamed protein product [Rotaria sp. Silwood2]CAF4193410.1 unnamed protein product [Rotaria sp. Silwood2]
MSIKNNSTGDWRLLLSDKVVFITGGAGWIARHIAKTCYDHGARLVLADMNIDTIIKMKNETFGSENTDDRILIVQLDVQDEETIKKAIELTLNKWNTINILINTAAAFTLGYVEDVSADDWSHIMNINVRGYALMVKYIAPILKKQNSGSIINFASTAGLVAHSTFLPYSTSKAAIIQLTRNLALDLGSFNIRVNSISPGAVESPTIYRTAAETGFTKEKFDELHAGKCIKRLAHAQEVANMTVFLASDLCSFMTGTNIVIDGGYTTV